MYFLIGADIVPTEKNVDIFIKGDRDRLVGNQLGKILDEASYRIFNLETPLTDENKEIAKKGPNLIAPTASVNGYNSLSVDMLTLANNHILDQDEQGLKSTLNVLDSAGIKHLGADNNLELAAMPYMFNFNKKTVGVYACVEHEFSVAKQNKPGANPFDPLWSFDHVQELKQNTEYVIVLYHGGKEHYRYPSPMLQKVCRRFVDKGADLVVCQHSHCVGCEEKYRGGTIVYGQGNFIFDDSSDECWKTGLLIKVDERFIVSYVPLLKDGNGVRLADDKNAKSILDGFYSRSAEIHDPGFIEKKYDDFANEFLPIYLSKIKGKECVAFKVLNKISRGNLRKLSIRQKYDIRHLLTLWNWMDCESHNELLSRGIKNKVQSIISQEAINK